MAMSLRCYSLENYLTVHLTYRRLLGRWEVVRVNWESAKEWMRCSLESLQGA